MEPSFDGVFSQSAREPSQQQWEMLKKLDSSSISLEEFLHHWRLNKTQLARVCGCDRRTIHRWLSQKYELTESQKKRLSLVHRLWSRS